MVLLQDIGRKLTVLCLKSRIPVGASKEQIEPEIAARIGAKEIVGPFAECRDLD